MPFPDSKYPPATAEQGSVMGAWTVLVAFCVYGTDFADAQRRLMARLPDPEIDGHASLDCWWIADDDRVDGSDNDSAVFVPKGTACWAYDTLQRYSEVRT